MLSIGYGKYGGTELSAERLRDWLVDNGLDVSVISTGDSKNIIKVPTLGVWRIFWPFFAYLISVTYVLTNSVDVIYSRFATYPLFVGIILKLLTKKPLVVSVHGGDIRHGFPFRWFITGAMRCADVVVCYDNLGHIQDLKNRGIEPVVIPNGIDIREFKPKRSHDKTNNIIYVGGKRSIKGINDFISLAKKFDDRKDVVFKIYGCNGNDSGVLKYCGRVKHEVMRDIFEAGQLMILPSHAEGVPGALLEAMASGMYVVASDIDFTRTVLDKRFLFKPKDVVAMSELVIEFCENKKEFFGDQNKRNREIILKSYSMDIVGEKWKQLLLGLIKRA